MNGAKLEGAITQMNDFGDDMKTTVVYHSADYDGIFCREIARKFLPDAELIGWNFGDAHLPQPTSGSGHYVVMDLPIDRVFGVRFEDGWIASDNPIMSHDERQIQPLDRCNFSNITSLPLQFFHSFAVLYFLVSFLF